MSGYFAPLVSLPTIIAEPGRYMTRVGEIVDVDVMSPQHRFVCAGRYADGTSELWHRSGRLYATTETRNDIVARVDDEAR